jgi:hypothetical protein
LDTDGEIFRKRANDVEALLDIAVNFIISKGLYDEYMKSESRLKYLETRMP